MTMTPFAWKCGHEARITGTDTAQIEQEYCPDCDQFRHRTGLYLVKPRTLVAISGSSEAQVEMATDLRRQVAVEMLHSRIQQAAKSQARLADMERMKQVFTEVINLHPDAKWWIDNRDNMRRALDVDYEKRWKEA